MFDKRACEDSEKYFNETQLTPVQLEIVENIADDIYPRLDIPKLAAQGFILKGIIGWQRAEKKTVQSLSFMTYPERIATVKIMFDRMEWVLVEILKQKKDAITVREAFQIAFTNYQDSALAKRSSS
ncbi:MAG: hypothetical protein ACTSWW_03665 [Promethearchaeota archaeon]